jgi:hypothetical protein
MRALAVGTRSILKDTVFSGYNAVQSVESKQTFRGNIVFIFMVEECTGHETVFTLCLFFYLEDTGRMFLRNVG